MQAAMACGDVPLSRASRRDVRRATAVSCAAKTTFNEPRPPPHQCREGCGLWLQGAPCGARAR
jgi:hypothetical protein